jgi:hypothetical protein
MRAIALCTRGALDSASRGRSTAALGGNLETILRSYRRLLHRASRARGGFCCD